MKINIVIEIEDVLGYLRDGYNVEEAVGKSMYILDSNSKAIGLLMEEAETRGYLSRKHNRRLAQHRR